MGKIKIIIGLIAEFAILIVLLWKHTDLYDFECLFILLLVSPILFIYHWFLLSKEHKRNRFTRAVQLKLFFLTGPSIILCLSLLLSINFELKRTRIVGGADKEMGMALRKMALNKDENYPDSIPQWVKYNVKKMKSDMILYAMLLVSFCLLYKERYFSSYIQSVDNIDPKSKNPPVVQQ